MIINLKAGGKRVPILSNRVYTEQRHALDKISRDGISALEF